MFFFLMAKINVFLTRTSQVYRKDGLWTVVPQSVLLNEVQQPADTENISALDQSISVSKESKNPSSNQAKGVKVAENQSPSGVEVAVDAADREVNTEPTEAQKEAAAPVSTTEEGSRLAELRTKYPGRVFGELLQNILTE